MSTRLQVVLDDAELDEIRQAAEAERLTVSEWVRQSLRAARSNAPNKSPEDKIRAIRRAARHSFPTADPDQMLREIERGRLE